MRQWYLIGHPSGNNILDMFIRFMFCWCRFDDNIIEGEAVPDHIQKIVTPNYDDSESVHDLAFSCTSVLLDSYAGESKI